MPIMHEIFKPLADEERERLRNDDMNDAERAAEAKAQAFVKVQIARYFAAMTAKNATTATRAAARQDAFRETHAAGLHPAVCKAVDTLWMNEAEAADKGKEATVQSVIGNSLTWYFAADENGRSEAATAALDATHLPPAARTVLFFLWNTPK